MRSRKGKEYSYKGRGGTSYRDLETAPKIHLPHAAPVKTAGFMSLCETQKSSRVEDWGFVSKYHGQRALLHAFMIAGVLNFQYLTILFECSLEWIMSRKLSSQNLCLTRWSRRLLQNLTDVHLLMNFPVFYANRIFITVFQSAHLRAHVKIQRVWRCGLDLSGSG